MESGTAATQAQSECQDACKRYDDVRRMLTSAQEEVTKKSKELEEYRTKARTALATKDAEIERLSSGVIQPEAVTPVNDAGLVRLNSENVRLKDDYSLIKGQLEMTESRHQTEMHGT